jgi:hypothetical protein
MVHHVPSKFPMVIYYVPNVFPKLPNRFLISSQIAPDFTEYGLPKVLIL